MQNQAAVETLHKKRTELIIERDAFLSRISTEISGIESAIESLSGLKVWETEPETLYDDENPNYIRSSQEEI
jgi:hypothetical protein